MQSQVKSMALFRNDQTMVGVNILKLEDLREIYGGDGLFYDVGKWVGKTAHACWDAANDFAAGFFDGLLGN